MIRVTYDIDAGPSDPGALSQFISGEELAKTLENVATQVEQEARGMPWNRIVITLSVSKGKFQ